VPTEIDAAQIVRIENYGDYDFDSSFNGSPFHIPAGESRYVPMAAACCWMGNYHDTGTTRQQAVELLHYAYGFTDFSEGSWDETRPPLRVFNQETDERMWFPADDPENLHGSAVEVAKENVTPAASIASLEDQIAELRKAIGQQPVQPTEVPLDKPSRIKVG